MQEVLFNNSALYYVATQQAIQVIEIKKHLEISEITEQYKVYLVFDVFKYINNSTLFDTNDVEASAFKLACEPSTLILKQNIIQLILRLSLEPIYGFTFGKASSTFDEPAINANYRKLDLLSSSNFSLDTKSVVLDTTKLCSTRISKTTLRYVLSQIIFPIKYKSILFKILKTSLLNSTCDNSLIIALNNFNLRGFILNVALYGIENFGFTRSAFHHRKSAKLYFLSYRYLTSVVYFLNKSQTTDRFFISLQNFFACRGINISCDFLSVSNLKDGFNFFTWYFVWNKNLNHFFSTPTINNWLVYKTSVKYIFRNSNYPFIKRLQLLRKLYIKWHMFNLYSNLYFFKKQIFQLKVWANICIRKSTNINKFNRFILINYIFPKQDSF